MKISRKNQDADKYTKSAEKVIGNIIANNNILLDDEACTIIRKSKPHLIDYFAERDFEKAKQHINKFADYLDELLRLKH